MTAWRHAATDSEDDSEDDQESAIDEILARRDRIMSPDAAAVSPLRLVVNNAPLARAGSLWLADPACCSCSTQLQHALSPCHARHVSGQRRRRLRLRSAQHSLHQ